MESIRMPSPTDDGAVQGATGTSAGGRGSAAGGLATRLFALGLGFEVANAAYLAAFDSATIFYHAMVVAHVVAGLFLLPLGLALAVRWLRLRALLRTWGAGLRVAAAGAAIG